jgi:hypothetical protein
LGQSWIINQQKEDGLFRYQYNLKEQEYAEENNLVRQVGTFYGLVRSYQFFSNEAARPAIMNFRQGISDYIKYDIIDNKEIAYLEYDEVAKLNAQALYILALAELKKQGFALTEKELSDAKKIIQGIEMMESEDGGFWYLYYLPEVHNRISIYGSGEALFALAQYYQYVEKNSDYLSLAKKHFALLYPGALAAENFADEEARAFHSWVLYYLASLEQIEPGQFEYIVPLMARAFEYKEKNPACRNENCIISPDAGIELSLLEGFSAAYPLFSIQDRESKNKLKEYIEFGIERVGALQIKTIQDYKNKTGQDYGDKPENIIGGFCEAESCNYLRIDIAQHALGALMNVYE